MRTAPRTVICFYCPGSIRSSGSYRLSWSTWCQGKNLDHQNDPSLHHFPRGCVCVGFCANLSFPFPTGCRRCAWPEGVEGREGMNLPRGQERNYLSTSLNLGEPPVLLCLSAPPPKKTQRFHQTVCFELESISNVCSTVIFTMLHLNYCKA